MGKFSHKVWLLLFACLGMGLILIFSVKGPETKYQGKSVSEWFVEFCRLAPAKTVFGSPNGTGPAINFDALTGRPAPIVLLRTTGRVLLDGERMRPIPDPPADALRALGSKAVPYLTKMVRKHDPWLVAKYRQWRSKLSPWWCQRLPSPGEDPARLREQAAMALAGLGTNARPAIPVLLSNLKDPQPKHSLLTILGNLGCSSADVLPVLRELSSRHQHWQVIEIVRSLKLRDHALAPVLGQALQDTNNQVRAEAIVLLMEFGPGAKAALPALRVALGDPDEEVRYLATSILDTLGRQAQAGRPGISVP